MSTHAAIIHLKHRSWYEGVYCHFDGYLDGVGRTLQEHYRDTKKVAELIKLGNLSCLGAEVHPDPDQPHHHPQWQENVTRAYIRDYNDSCAENTSVGSHSLSKVVDSIGVSRYNYVFIPDVFGDQGTWHLVGYNIEVTDRNTLDKFLLDKPRAV